MKVAEDEYIDNTGQAYRRKVGYIT
jgi:hypothetical protein